MAIPVSFFKGLFHTNIDFLLYTNFLIPMLWFTNPHSFWVVKFNRNIKSCTIPGLFCISTHPQILTYKFRFCRKNIACLILRLKHRLFKTEYIIPILKQKFDGWCLLRGNDCRNPINAIINTWSSAFCKLFSAMMPVIQWH